MSEENKPLWAQNIPTRTQIKWDRKMSEEYFLDVDIAEGKDESVINRKIIEDLEDE